LQLIQQNIATLDNNLRRLIESRIAETALDFTQKYQTLEASVNEYKAWSARELKNVNETYERFRLATDNAFYLRDL
jgi:hypothetical protein